MKSTKSGHIGLLIGIGTASFLAATAAAEAPASDLPEDVIYRHTTTRALDGTVSETIEGSTIVSTSSGDFAVTPKDLVDPDGNTYGIDWDVGQAASDEPVVARIVIRRTYPESITEDERIDSYLEAVPDASDEELDAFMARRSARAEEDTRAPELGMELQDWLAGAEEGERLPIEIIFADQPALELPDIDGSLAESDPVAWLDARESRVLAIEDRKSEIRDIQAAFVAEVEALGADVEDRHWLVNGVGLEVTPEILLTLASDPRIRRMDTLGEAAPATNQGDEIRDATGINTYLDDNRNGETSSGRSAVNDIYIGVVDTTLDMNHPAWDDTSGGSSRLVDLWRYSGGSWSNPGSSATSSGSHGTRVSGQLIADLTQGQDSSYPGSSTAAQLARTGMTTESSFSFIEVGGGIINAIEKATDLDVDIATMSIVMTDQYCDLTDSRVPYVNAAYHAGVFWSQAAGNDGQGGCYVEDPGSAAAAFVVGATNVSAADLTTAGYATYTAEGGDSEGRPLIHVVAPGGRQGGLLTDYNDAYTSSTNNGTSFAAPVLAGATANFKDHMIDLFGTSFANSVGNLYASMILMGDGYLQTGGYATAGTAVDDITGTGRW